MIRHAFPLMLLITLLFGFGCSKSTTDSAHSDDPHRTHTVSKDQPSAFSVQFNSPTQGLPLNAPQTISFSVTTKDSRIVKDFAENHEKIMHVILVRKDLNTFDHIHPTFDETLGQFTFTHTFTAEGEYRMYADFVSKNGGSAVAQGTLLAGSGTGDYRALKPQVDVTEAVGPFTITYTLPHNRIVAKEEIQYALAVEEKNKPVIIEPYLGAMGHSVILREESLDYIHTHPVSSSELRFATTFPTPGVYAVFTQFQVKGKVYTAKRIMKVGDKDKIDIGDIKLDFIEAK